MCRPCRAHPCTRRTARRSMWGLSSTAWREGTQHVQRVRRLHGGRVEVGGHGCRADCCQNTAQLLPRKKAAWVAQNGGGVSRGGASSPFDAESRNKRQLTRSLVQHLYHKETHHWGTICRVETGNHSSRCRPPGCIRLPPHTRGQCCCRSLCTGLR